MKNSNKFFIVVLICLFLIFLSSFGVLFKFNIDLTTKANSIEKTQSDLNTQLAILNERLQIFKDEQIKTETDSNLIVVKDLIRILGENLWLDFKATAYNINDPNQGTTNINAFGFNLENSNIQKLPQIAADPEVLALGTIVEISGLENYNGIYIVTDIGIAIKGYKIDILMPDLKEAQMFGIKDLKLRILKKGICLDE